MRAEHFYFYTQFQEGKQNNFCTGSWVMETDRVLPVWREFKWCMRDWLLCDMQMQIYPWGITTTKSLTIMLISPKVISYYGFLPAQSSRASFPKWTGVSPLSPSSALTLLLKPLDWQLKRSSPLAKLLGAAFPSLQRRSGQIQHNGSSQWKLCWPYAKPTFSPSFWA